MFKRFQMVLSCSLVLACTSAPKNNEGIDSLALAPDSISASASPVQDEASQTPPSIVDPNLKASDTLYNVLARKGALKGEFVGVNVITGSFIDIHEDNKPRKLMAVLVQTGEGEYSGGREGVAFETIHSVLGVFEVKEDTYSLIDFSDLGDGGGSGLRLYLTEGESLKLAEGQDAAMIHYKSSESGAGDYGFDKDEVVIYVLLNDKITNVLETTLNDYQWASDEQTSTSEQTITTEMTVLEEVTNGLFDIRLKTTTERSATEEESEGEERTDDEKKEDEKSEDENAEPDEGIVYKWNGANYEKGTT